jgi:hypothetical protein
MANSGARLPWERDRQRILEKLVRGFEERAARDA